MGTSSAHRGTVAAIAALLAGMLAGTMATWLAGAAFARRATVDVAPAQLEATHVPALLTAAGETVALRYDAYCIARADAEADAACQIAGEVYVRPGLAGVFRHVPLRLDPATDEGRYVAVVPRDIAASANGFTYFAVLRDEAHGTETTIPPAGSAAPHRSFPLGHPIAVSLGAHAFGRPRAATERVASAAWGSGADELGLEQSPNLDPIGASGFDVDSAGTVFVLDEARRQLVRWDASRREPTRLSLAIDGTLADLSVDDQGAVYVLESNGHGVGERVLRIFGRDGVTRGTVALAERADQVRVGPSGAVVLAQPSGQWLSATSAGRPLSPSSQRRSARAGRPVRGGDEVVVLRVGDEIRVALVRADEVRRSWRITSDTALAEVQLAEPLGGRLVLVARVYTEREDEFVVLVLGPHGLEHTFSLDSADWAEAAPLSRFRVAGSSLYQLGSNPAGVFVDRFRLEVR